MIGDDARHGAGAAGTHPAGRPPLLVAEGLSKTFRPQGFFKSSGRETRALENVSVRLEAGEMLGLVGESGCGKSTFAKVLLGLAESDAGALTFDGRAIFGHGQRAVPADQRGIQMVFQDPFGSLNPRMTLLDLVGEGLRIRGMPSQEISREVREHLALVGLAGSDLGKYAHQFSGGQRQRICIARAIIMKPKLLIADEAVSALDVSVQMQILNLLLELRERLGLSIIFISHDMGVIEYLCDRIVVMYRGRIVEQGTAAGVIDAPRHPYTAHLIAARPGLKRIDFGETAASRPPEVPPGPQACNFVERCPRRLPKCSTQAPDLAPAGFACFNPNERAP